MYLCVNGQNREFIRPLNVKLLLEQLELNPERVVVELNRDILTSDKYVDIQLQDGDTLELIQFVGGG
ncbi:MAG: sulfur carrier protein ThiS [Pseudomonadota bacterium]|nr:sulfur carrier protein ThiS [Pseudomonadota bacterium]